MVANLCYCFVYFWLWQTKMPLHQVIHMCCGSAVKLRSVMSKCVKILNFLREKFFFSRHVASNTIRQVGTFEKMRLYGIIPFCLHMLFCYSLNIFGPSVSFISKRCKRGGGEKNERTKNGERGSRDGWKHKVEVNVRTEAKTEGMTREGGRRRDGRQRRGRDTDRQKDADGGKLYLMAKMRTGQRRRGMILLLIGNPIQSRPLSVFCARVRCVYVSWWHLGTGRGLIIVPATQMLGSPKH